jgi:hypothetical protein
MLRGKPARSGQILFAVCFAAGVLVSVPVSADPIDSDSITIVDRTVGFGESPSELTHQLVITERPVPQTRREFTRYRSDTSILLGGGNAPTVWVFVREPVGQCPCVEVPGESPAGQISDIITRTFEPDPNKAPGFNFIVLRFLSDPTRAPPLPPVFDGTIPPRLIRHDAEGRELNVFTENGFY